MLTPSCGCQPFLPQVISSAVARTQVDRNIQDKGIVFLLPYELKLLLVTSVKYKSEKVKQQFDAYLPNYINSRSEVIESIAGKDRLANNLTALLIFIIRFGYILCIA